MVDRIILKIAVGTPHKWTPNNEKPKNLINSRGKRFILQPSDIFVSTDYSDKKSHKS
jgi:hypothetical protein